MASSAICRLKRHTVVERSSNTSGGPWAAEGLKEWSNEGLEDKDKDKYKDKEGEEAQADPLGLDGEAKVVFLQHGLMGSSDNWNTNTMENSLGMCLFWSHRGSFTVRYTTFLYAPQPNIKHDLNAL